MYQWSNSPIQYQQSVAVSERYMVAVCTLALSSPIGMASKYLSMCHKKLSNSRASLTPLKILGSGIHTLGTS
ncbi:hypothetical protein AMTRI_Chr05g68810 [Amborella trichopoda]